jgi:hemerythrin-like metal-binding protein
MNRPAFDPEHARLHLGVEAMDRIHREFVELVDAMAEAHQARFLERFDRLADHTTAHFESEDRLKAASGFPAPQEHRNDHRRVLRDLSRACARAVNDCRC